ncbi:cryptochrome/photolyase family protein [Candidatus Neptunochlamydia vexilliferae]|uniref:(6-4) photolyase n=1 Tax=Candidatus Neptunichlamydia vexilliferae TaxID=1651774 RepID=A0ABS0AYJ2_9BACT|nr:cryptochrome/photolyase family protein [Candidatus Neptunochlamydia vexilliferae]MBF5059204.1 (6-4) photolyase [Candidatus Neptunochlamydia vexilliferae]
MGSLRLVLGDQLSETLTALEGCDKKKDSILFCETLDEFTHVKHHKKKIAFLISARRHFASLLKKKKYPVYYVELTQDSLSTVIQKVMQDKKLSRLIVTFPSEYHVLKELEALKVELEIRSDTRFLSTPEEFAAWAKGRKELMMEFFYREMRKKHQVLMEQKGPIGGKWNYDAENRNPPKEGLQVPPPYEEKQDRITQEALALVKRHFSTHFGDLAPFYFAVTREGALKALDLFITERLPLFGHYQDAMIEKEPWMFHSHISFYINTGLLEPLEVIERAEEAYQKEKAPLSAVEGFIRQILGWREYVRGIYWLKMPQYATLNFFNAKRSLPEFFWTGKTPMNCLAQCVRETKENAYAHHIQRLMVLGNFALIAGLYPDEVNEWYWIVYADAYQWVELPNVTGMILYADGGILGTKPYAASGAYINKMSNYCKNCAYNVKEKNGEKACPFNYLYWDFLLRNQTKLSDNRRLQMIYRTLQKMDPERIKMIKEDAEGFLTSL